MTSLLKKRLLLVWLDKDTELQDNSFGMLILKTLKKYTSGIWFKQFNQASLWAKYILRFQPMYFARIFFLVMTMVRTFFDLIWEPFKKRFKHTK